MRMPNTPDPKEFVMSDHRAEADNPDLSVADQAVHALLAIHDLLDERLPNPDGPEPERTEPVDPDPDARAEKAMQEYYARVTEERDALRGRVDGLIRERDAAINRHKALRTDISRYCGSIFASKAERTMAEWLVDRDDERAEQ